jgi:DNA-binding MarR family transcriptional regulator
LALSDALVRISHLVDEVFTGVSRELDLPPQQAQLLCLLIGGPVGMSELTRLLNIGRPSLSGLVDRVEQRGLISRVPDTTDRRANQVVLTALGRRTAARCHRRISARLDDLTAALGATGRTRLASDLVRVLAQHTAAGGRPWTMSG